jgi:hypothetical protein
MLIIMVTIFLIIGYAIDKNRSNPTESSQREAILGSSDREASFLALVVALYYHINVSMLCLSLATAWEA